MKAGYFNSVYFCMFASFLFHITVFTVSGLFNNKKAYKVKIPIHLKSSDIIIQNYDEISDRVKINNNTGAEGRISNIQEALITYRELLRTEIYKNLEYPDTARRKRLEGEAMINFSISRDGKLLKYKIIKRTGFYILDNAVKKVFRKINKFPDVPDFIQNDILKFNLAISFNLKELNRKL